MHVVYALELIPETISSIFLAGPSYRPYCPNSESLYAEYDSNCWRTDAIRFLATQDFKGTVFIPELREYSSEWTYSRQVDWEIKALEKATVILFWIPRNLETLPGFTTNIEFGKYMSSGKIVVGAPPDTPHTQYIFEMCQRYNIPTNSTLVGCVNSTLDLHSKLGGNSLPNIFYTADTHFKEERTRILSRRPFSSVEEMDKEMVARWNSVVRPNDMVFHLGDFGEPTYIQFLNGKICLLPGNYDTQEVLGQLALLSKEPFSIITNNSLATGIDLPTGTCGLVHKPNDALGHEFYLYAHIHALQKVKINGLNVGMDCHNFTPIHRETVMFYYNAIRNHYDYNVFINTL